MLPNQVQVVLVAYYGDRWLLECLRTLSGAASQSMRLILVNNGDNSGDLSNLPLNKFNTTIIKAARPLGFAEANNFALQQVPPETDAVCFLNQDTRSEPGWLDACLESLRRDADVGAVSPLMRTYDGGGWDESFLSCVRGAYPDFAEAALADRLPGWIETRVVTAAAMVIRTEALLKAGPFDPIFGSYYEDYDLCRRVRAAGYRVGVCTEGTVNHYSGSSTTTASARRRRMRQIIRNRAILQLRESGPHRLIPLVRQFGYRFPYNLLRGLVRTPSSQPPSVQLAAHWDLLRLLSRICSERRDDRAWRQYLKSLDWPGANAGREPASV